MSIESSLRRTSRKEFLPFARPDIGEEEIAAVREVLESGWLTTGRRVAEFETKFAAMTGAKNALAVNSCTAALHLSLEAIGLRAGDEVIVPTYTFAATAEVVRYFNARPRLVDIDPHSLNISVREVAAAVNDRTKAIIPVHFAGLAADLDGIQAIGAQHSIAVVEDAAHSFPAVYKSRSIGSISTTTCFSFYATKTMTTGEGGMICTNSDAIANRCRTMALHGLSRDAWTRYATRGSWHYDIVAPGFKYNMTDLAAALGLVQLRKAPAMLRHREAIASAYDRAFSEIGELVELPARSEHASHAWALYPLRLTLERLRMTRDEIIDELNRRRIGVSVHFIPLHVHPYYAQTYGYRPADFPVAWAQYQREISLPIYSRMSEADVEDVAGAVIDIVRNNIR